MLPHLHPETLFKNEVVHIQLYAQASLLFAQWLRHPSSPEFRQHFRKIADLILEHNCRYWLSDSRAIHFLDYGDQNWFLREMQRLSSSSLLKIARLMTYESLTMLDTQRIIDRLEADSYPVQVKFFLDKESALDWLFPEK
jgi:hypothetical protein